MLEIIKDCRCINKHDAGVIIVAIDHMSQDREYKLKELRKRADIKNVEFQINTYEDDMKELALTRKRLTNTPVC